jgi:hypothetical protein
LAAASAYSIAKTGALRSRGLRGKRSDQSGANTAVTVTFVEIDVQMAR